MRRRSTILTAVTLTACLGVVGPQIAESAPREDPRAEREQVRAERAQVAAQIDTSKASIAEIDAALAAISDNLATQEAALTKATNDVADAEQDIADAEAAIARLTEEIDVLRTDMAERTVRAFVNPAEEDLLSVLTTDDLNDATNRSVYIQLRSLDDADVADRLAGAQVDLSNQREKAAEARVRAEEKRAEQQSRTESVRQAQDDQARLFANAEATLQQQIERSVSLAKTDAALSKKIAQQQAELAARLAAERARQEEARRAAEAEAARAAERERQQAASTPSTPTTTTPPSNQDPGGGETDPLPPLPPPTNSGNLCTVGGITVNCAIQGSLSNMLNAARADGLVLTGGGYRDSSMQITLRRAHCGTSNYAIYYMPASQCTPPTAPPGRSQHEVGLAIDFNSCSRSSNCFQWLRANAGRFGFYNLPSESWHWSTTGN